MSTWPRKITAGVAGWPIHHSLSPLMHQSWIKALNLDADYLPFMVNPHTAVQDFRTLPKSGLAGLNVTVPLKTKAFDAADILTKTAKAIGAVNCLYMKDGQLIGHNTDKDGFLAGMPESVKAAVKGRPARIIGAGGAARAVMAALADLEVSEVQITNRTTDNAVMLSEAFPGLNSHAVHWKEKDESLGDVALLINCTSAGMTGKKPLHFDLASAGTDMFVYDLIYTPQKTDLIKAAKAKGLKTQTGLAMLIGQARPSFERFFNVAPPNDVDIAGILKQALKQK